MADIMNEEAINIEDLRAILASKGLDIKELAREAKEMKIAEKTEKAVSTSRKCSVTSDPVFELILADYPDFVIRRSTAKTEKLLVIMPSQDSYYIKTVKNGAENMEVLDRKNYGSFTSGMEDIKLPEDFWLNSIQAGVGFFDDMMYILGHKAIVKAIVGGYYVKTPSVNYRYREEEMYENIPNIMKAFPGKDFYSEWNIIKQICDKFGIENTRELIRERETSLITKTFGCARYSNIEELLAYDFKFSSFKEYVLYDSVRMGYGTNFDTFVREWSDTLYMQTKIYGKIKDKYPRHLSEMHLQLAYKMELMRQEIDKCRFAERDTSKFEATVEDYVFIAPKEPQDFYDEATAQSNCLAGYIERYADGKDYIVFMRKKDTPEVSLVTIELDLNGNLCQAYQARNTSVTKEQQDVINKWLTNTVSRQFAAVA